ncbi:hypothetical protein VTO42DRAFT_4608 [Malbranchea cinnamomea]
MVITSSSTGRVRPCVNDPGLLTTWVQLHLPGHCAENISKWSATKSPSTKFLSFLAMRQSAIHPFSLLSPSCAEQQ